MKAIRAGKIVYRKKDPKIGEIVARYPKLDDLRALWQYANELSKEETFVGLQGEKITLVRERAYLKGRLKEIKSKTGVTLMLFCENELCGVSGVTLKDVSSAKHCGLFGISISKRFRGRGLGKLLMRLVLAEAKERLRGLQIVTLGVFVGNQIGKRMYRKFGFKRYGSLPRGARRAGKYVAHELMYKNIKGRT